MSEGDQDHVDQA